jgi:hypothetical protein
VGRLPCKELFRWQSKIVRTLALCRIARRSPGEHPGIHPFRCRDIIAAGTDVIRRAVIHGGGADPFSWNNLAHAYLADDDYRNAYRSFVVSSLILKAVDLDTSPFMTLMSTVLFRSPSLKARAEILRARAKVKVYEWHGEDPPAEIAAQAAADWPTEESAQQPAPPE